MKTSRLELAILFFVCISISISLYLVMQNRRVISAYEQRELKMVTELLASDHESAIGGVRQFLIALSHNLENSQFDPTKCTEILNRELVIYPYFLNLGVVDIEGNIVCSGVSARNVTYTNEPDFQRLVSSESFTVSGYHVSRLTGRPAVRFLQPFYDQGKLAGAILASFGTEWLNGFSPSFQFSDSIVITKFDPKGNIFMRYPNPVLWSGTDQAESELFKEITSTGEGLVTARGLDGKTRRYYFRPIYLDGELNAYIAAGR